ncbi:putative Mg2+ transporter-C (MgtC) family protein [Roseovarius halotolerans]|uniref:Protein MgtC n=1 Tax=Roseovarius halotolerans TaxID=505353 RepID=A0A1X6ZEZ1_9RHOB|nr:MgtC/SapB family protein [Roseovarius halotolerans]RKT30795.1 putative Mg2+ transporter-C (MgtC) family protein [Roseovarius halotolerans]SLN49534.1 putative Mg(2+) transport ATPase [Roseovarius halotolerans]
MIEQALEVIAKELSGTFAAVPPLVAATRLLAALVLGGLIGFEREWVRKPAGLRTHMLVSIAACLFIIVSQQLAHLPFGDKDALRVDPLRLIEAVTAGVAFLAAGAIFTSGGKVHNITTGASMWLAGAIGLACGAGQMPLALMVTAIVLIVLIALRVAEPSQDEDPDAPSD